MSNNHRQTSYRIVTSLLSVTLLLMGLAALSGCRASEERQPQTSPLVVTELLTAVAPATAEPTTTVPAAETAALDPPAADSAITPQPVDPTPSLPPATPSPAPDPGGELAIDSSKLFIYPTGNIYAGDEVTIQFAVILPPQINPDDVEVEIELNDQLLERGQGFQLRNLGGDIVGLYPWVWDTNNAPGTYTLSVTLDPNDRITAGDANPLDNTAMQTVRVLPRSAMDNRTAAADWITIETDLAYIHVVAGTAAERDLNRLIPLTDNAIRTAAIRLQEEPSRKYDVFFIDRVIGQGGYATGSMVVSYLDRNYAGGGVGEVLTHEAIHLLDQQFIRGERPAFLAEGVAVWATGGHYKQENLANRVRALESSSQAFDLTTLIDNFYPVQHEIGYLQAGGFMEYLVNRYGWAAVKEFYANIPSSGEKTSKKIDAALRTNFGQSLQELEATWRATLAQQAADPVEVSDLTTTLKYYDVMRAYQLIYDPTAHFEQAWLPAPRQLLERNSTAELSRKPGTVENLTLEILLTEADAALRKQDYPQANLYIQTVDRVLRSGGSFVDPLAKSHFDVVATSLEWGFEPHRISIDGNVATLKVTNPFSADLLTVQFFRDGPIWVLVRETE